MNSSIQPFIKSHVEHSRTVAIVKANFPHLTVKLLVLQLSWFIS